MSNTTVCCRNTRNVVHTHVHIYVESLCVQNLFVRMSAYVCVCMHLCTCVSMAVCKHVCMRVYMHTVHMDRWINGWTDGRTYVCACTHNTVYVYMSVNM